MESTGSNYVLDAVGVTDTNGNYVVGVEGGLTNVTWNIEPADDNFNSDYKFILDYTVAAQAGGSFAVNSNTAVQANLTAIAATNTISGRFTDNYGNPIGGIEMFAYATISDVSYFVYQDYTDSGGNYSINVCNGSWTVGVDDFSGQFNQPPLSNYICPTNHPVMLISNDNQVTNFMAISLVPEPSGITSVTQSEANLVFNGTNGLSGGTYYALMSTNLTLPFSQWTPVATNVLSASGNFTITVTNAVNVNASKRFFILNGP